MNSLRFFVKCAVLTTLTAGAALAQQGDFPSKTVRLVVPQGAGGSSDGLARSVAERLSLRWGKVVVVDNKPGAGGNIGSEIVAKSAPDGHTILLGYLGTSAINGALYKNLTYSPERDLVPAVGLATVPYVIVANPKLAARDLQELVRMAKARRVTYASAGTGTVNHLVGELFNSAAQIQMTHIPYKTAVQAMTDTMSGQTDINIGTLGTMFQQAGEAAGDPDAPAPGQLPGPTDGHRGWLSAAYRQCLVRPVRARRHAAGRRAAHSCRYQRGAARQGRAGQARGHGCRVDGYEPGRVRGNGRVGHS